MIVVFTKLNQCLTSMRSEHTIAIHRHHRNSATSDSVPSSFPVGRCSASVQTSAQSSDRQKKTYGEKVTPKFVPTITDPKYIRMRELVLAEGSFRSIPDSDLNVLVIHLRECAQKCAAKRKFVKADEFTRLAQEAREELTERTLQRDDPTARVAESQARMDYLAERKDQQLQLFDEETDQMRSELTEKQGADRTAFNHHWSQAMPNRYRKPSAQLLQLKQIEKSLTIAGDYVAALNAQQRIEAQERIEVEIQQGQLDDDYSAAKRKFESEKTAEVELFERKRDAARAGLELSLQRALQRQENRINVTKNKCPLSRKARSDNKTRSVGDGSSFAKVAREKNIEIDASLPTLRAPSDRRRVRINSDCARKGIVRPPRAYLPTNEAIEGRPVFKTQAGRTQFMADEDE
jgi:hypothetical protein